MQEEVFKKWAQTWSLAQGTAPPHLPHPTPCPWLRKVKEDKSYGERKRDSQEEYTIKALGLPLVAMATHKSIICALSQPCSSWKANPEDVEKDWTYLSGFKGYNYEIFNICSSEEFDSVRNLGWNQDFANGMFYESSLKAWVVFWRSFSKFS